VANRFSGAKECYVKKLVRGEITYTLPVIHWSWTEMNIGRTPIRYYTKIPCDI
jgi:hypothetical protein